jgi:secreted PhoX family phosphatase
MGITPDGRVYAFARNRLNISEFAGPCFSPDGQTFFVNIQDPGVTLAIWGSFVRPKTAGRSRMAGAMPPESLGPDISGELAEAAERHGMSRLEVAAYDRLGVSPAY